MEKALPLDPLCRLVWAACFEAALHIAPPETSAVGQQEMTVTLMGLIGGLRRKQEAGGQAGLTHLGRRHSFRRGSGNPTVCRKGLVEIPL